MAVEIANAVGAYNAAIRRVAENHPLAANPGVQDFSTMVKNFVENAVETGKASEAATAAAAVGQADINQVVLAVAEAEVTLNTVVALRDRILESYRTIIRMPI